MKYAILACLMWAALDTAYDLGRHAGLKEALWTMHVFNAGLEAASPNRPLT